MIQRVVYIIVQYYNRTDVMRTHQCLNNIRVKNTIVPTPNQISSSCGLSIKMRYSDIDKLMYVIKLNKLSVNYKIFGEVKGANKTIYTIIK